MKTSRPAALVVAFLMCGFTALTQTVTLNGIPEEGISVPSIRCTPYGGFRIVWCKIKPPLMDGSNVKVAWSHPTIASNRLDVSTVVSLVEVSFDGTPVSASDVTFDNMNPAGGNMLWIPRSVETSTGWYKIQVKWRDGFGEILATAQSFQFRINLSGNRAIIMTDPLNTVPSMVRGMYDGWWIHWQTAGTAPIPADARIIIFYRVMDMSTGIFGETIRLKECSNTGATRLPGETFTPGTYAVGVAYLTATDIVVVASNEAIVIVVE